MAKRYEHEFKVMIVELLHSGRPVKEISEEYNLDQSMIRRWRRVYESKAGDFTKPNELSSEQQQIRRLKKELREAQLERDILKKAVSIFSKKDR